MPGTFYGNEGMPAWTSRFEQSDLREWDELYRKEGVIDPEPSSHVVSLVPTLKRENVQKILDHCCGAGRHVRYLAENDFLVVGTDISPEAIRLASRACAGLPDATLQVSGMDEIPYSDGFFDASLSLHGIQHGSPVQRRQAFKELYRSLRPKGLLFLRVISSSSPAYGLGDPVPEDPGTFSNIPGMRGPFRHFYREEELLSELSRFDLLEFGHHSSPKAEAPYFWPLHEFRALARKK